MSLTLAEAPAFRIKTEGLLAGLLFAVGFLSAQRFAAPTISAYTCVMPLMLALIMWPRRSMRNVLIIAALLSSVDYGDVVYQETAAPVRYVIYGLVLSIFVSGFKLDQRRAVLFLAYVSALLLITATNISNADGYTLARDGVTLGLLFLVIVRPGCEGQVVSVQSLNHYALGLLTAEILNVVLFFDMTATGHYLSYQSVKSIVTFSSIYYLVKGRAALALLLIAVTLVVLVNYATRAIFFSYLLVLILLGIRQLVLSRALGRATLIVGGLCLTAMLLAPLAGGSLETTRVTRPFALWMSMGLQEGLYAIDPVRYVEHELFFERGLARILAGDGLGSGFVDQEGAFSFVPFDSGAFSDRELVEGKYYRLHDAWIYFGLRFGLLAVLAVYTVIVVAITASSVERALVGCFALIALNCASFSIAGLLLTALLGVKLKGWRQPRDETPY